MLTSKIILHRHLTLAMVTIKDQSLPKRKPPLDHKMLKESWVHLVMADVTLAARRATMK